MYGLLLILQVVCCGTSVADIVYLDIRLDENSYIVVAVCHFTFRITLQHDIFCKPDETRYHIYQQEHSKAVKCASSASFKILSVINILSM
jgi:hypothetical protein